VNSLTHKPNQLQSVDDIFETIMDTLRELEKSKNKNNIEFEYRKNRVTRISKQFDESLRQQRELIHEMKQANDMKKVHVFAG
jgi:hypothetical protein